MTTPPGYAPPEPPMSLAAYVRQYVEGSLAPQGCSEHGLDFQDDILARLMSHGEHVDTLTKLQSFCRERFPRWHPWHECYLETDLEELGPSGAEYCRTLWSWYLTHIEVGLYHS